MKTKSDYKSLSLSALKTKAGELLTEALRAKSEAVIQKGPKDRHLSAKKRKELAKVKTRMSELEREETKNG